MNTSPFFILFIIVLGTWLSVLSYFVYKIYKLFSSLQNGIAEDLNKKGFDEVKKRLDYLEQDGKLHTQKISLVRFNPFKELGGDHSFSVAILNGEDSGIIITSLHTRDRTRVYMKNVKKGKSDTELSNEEMKALKDSLNKK